MTTRTREEVLDLYQTYLNGDSLETIGKREGYTRSRIGQLFDEYDLPRRKVGESSTQHRLAQEQRARQERDRIIELYKEYGTLKDVVREIELPRRLVSEVVDTIPNREAYRRRGRQTPRSKGSLVRDLKRAAERFSDEPLSIPAYRQVASELGLAAVNTQLKMFGSWAEALKTAGIEGNRPQGLRDNSITAEECVTFVAACWRSLGHRPSYEMYCEWSKDNPGPSGSTIRQKCGTWLSAVEAALDIL